MSDTHACITCKKTRPGRFTRHKHASGRGFSKGMTLPAWHCWSCLPAGEGRDEEVGVTKTTAINAPFTERAATTVLADKREGMALIPPLQKAVENLDIITTPAEYAAADTLFDRIRQARKTWNLKMYGTKDRPGPIPNIRQGLDQLYALNREVDKPLETLELAVERRMKAFKLEEQRLLREQKREQEAREQAAIQEAQELAERMEAVKTPAAKARVAQRLEEAENALVEIQQEQAPEPVRAEHSGTRPKKIPTITDGMAFIQGVAEGLIPEDCLTFNMMKLRVYYKDDPASVAEFPGVTIEDDITIVGR